MLNKARTLILVAGVVTLCSACEGDRQVKRTQAAQNNEINCDRTALNPLDCENSQNQEQVQNPAPTPPVSNGGNGTIGEISNTSGLRYFSYQCASGVVAGALGNTNAQTPIVIPTTIPDNFEYCPVGSAIGGVCQKKQGVCIFMDTRMAPTSNPLNFTYYMCSDRDPCAPVQ